MESTCVPDTASAKAKPEIVSEIETPFPDKKHRADDVDGVPGMIRLRDQEHSHHVEDLKNAVGKKLLYGCLITIALFAIADAVWSVDSPLFTSAFEVAKIVATTVLGYLFGSRTKF